MYNKYTSACAISLSWWGNFRSTPPVWISKLSPQIAEAITEHSICHPGRPRPQGLSHHGSPGLEAFQRAKSVGRRFSACSVNSPLKKVQKSNEINC